MAKQKAKAQNGEAAAAPPNKAYTPTPREAEVLKAFWAAKDAKKPSARIKIRKDDSGAYNLCLDHQDPETGRILLMQALGTTDSDFINCLMGQLAYASAQGNQVSEVGANFLLSVVKGIEPRDQLEAMLAAQMAATHIAAITFARRLANVDTIPQQDSASNAYNKLTRTFAAQMETLKRYRSNGEQRVIVERVTVQSGGQAIVGNVSHGAPANDGGQASHAAPAALPAPVETPLTLVVGGGEPQKKARVIP